MAYRLNPFVDRVAAAPIAEAQAWIRGREFPKELPLLDCAQAVPSYPPAPELTRHLAEAVQRPQTAFYTDILGRTDLCAALAAHLSAEYKAQVPSRGSESLPAAIRPFASLRPLSPARARR
jgi:aspartate/methionine/tyrosine aminotransferase